MNRATLHAHGSERLPELNDASCSVCITSPPYLNNFDFAEIAEWNSDSGITPGHGEKSLNE